MLPVPSFWKTDLDTINALAKSAKRAQVREIVRSAGNRPVYAFAYGEKQMIDQHANYNSACGAHDRRWFDGFEKKKPVVLLIGAVHGSETEGVAALVNLIELMENGKDLRGDDYPELVQAIEGVRLVIVPVANVDGRARVEPASMIGCTNEELRYWAQGTWKDGTLCGWPGCKQRHPIKEHAGFLGGYFNDDGVNLMHDQFFRPMAKETQALLDLAAQEHADYVIQLHGGSNSLADILQPAYVPLEISQRLHRLASTCDAAAKKEGLGFTVREVQERRESGATPPSFNLTSALHHVCGGVSCTFESNEHIADQPGPHQSHEKIYRSHLILFEQCCRQAIEEMA